MNSTITLAHIEHLDDVMKLVSQAVNFMNSNGNYQWDKTYPSKEIIRADIEKEHLYVVIANNELVAFVVLNASQSPEYQKINWNTSEKSFCIHRMSVSSKIRGTGIARKLFNFAEEIALSKGYKAIRSDTNSNNLPMNHIFKSLDYQFTGNIVLRGNPDLFNCYDKILK